MIERLAGLPDNVVAFAFHGHVTKTDYDTVLISEFEDRLDRHEKVRIYCEFAPGLAGFDPAAVCGLGHFFDWDRCAVISDVEWVKRMAKFSELLRILWPRGYRAFSGADAAKAREWIADPNGKHDEIGIRTAIALAVGCRGTPAKSLSSTTSFTTITTVASGGAATGTSPAAEAPDPTPLYSRSERWTDTTETIRT